MRFEHVKRFNSKMVQLKVCINIKNLKYICQFQFQNGTIKRNGQFNYIPESSSFNSKMVQLKAEENPKKRSVCTRFNSKMVQLKGASLAKSLTVGVVSIPKWYN